MPLYLSRSSTSAAPFERASGEDTFDRRLMNVQGIDPTSGFIMGSVFRATKTETTTQVLVRTGSTACAATPTTCKIGLYTVDDPSTMNLTRVAVTANDTTLFAATNSDYTRSWAASTTKVAGTLYAASLDRRATSKVVRDRYRRIMVPYWGYLAAMVALWGALGVLGEITPANWVGFLMPVVSMAGPKGPGPTRRCT